MSLINSYKIFTTVFMNLSIYLLDCFLTRFVYKLPVDDVVNKLSNLDKLIINICESLKNINIFYIKALQALSANNELFSENVINYMTEFSDQVPFDYDEFNLNEIKEVLKSKNIEIGNVPIASGTVACVFQGTDESNTYAVKVKRKNIDEKIENSCLEMRQIISFINKLPYFKYLNLLSTFDQNTPYIYKQLNFKHEFENLEKVYNANKRCSVYITPAPFYKEITENHDIIIMEFLEGLTLSQIPEKNKNEFCSLLAKFGLKSIFFDGYTHGDLHQGNCRFVIDKDEDNNEIEKLIVFDFGILCFIDEMEKDTMYRVCKNFFSHQFKQAATIIYNEISHPQEIKDNMLDESKEKLLQFLSDWGQEIVTVKKIVGPNDIHQLTKELSQYGLKLKDWFGKIIMAFGIHESIAKTLSKEKTFLDYASELIKDCEEVLG